MKFWTSEHIYEHDWETVTRANWKKYPNPMNPAVEAIDIVDRQISDGVLKTHRLISSRWGLPSWASRLLGADKTCYASEHSEIDPKAKVMTMWTKNLTFSNEVSVMEKLTYTPHPSKENCTLLKQQAVVTITNFPLSSYIEDYLTKTISSNANKGRQAMEWVIGKLNNNEVQELSHKAVKGMDDIAVTAKKGMSVVEDLTSSAKKGMDEITVTAMKGISVVEDLTSSAKKGMDEITVTAKKGMDEITVTAKKGISVVEDLTSSAKKGMKDINHFAEETLPNLHFEK